MGIVGVRFKQACRVYYFESAGLEIHVGDWVVVESPRGQVMAQVAIAPDQVIASAVAEPLKPVLRKATAEDVELASDLRQKEREALESCGQMAREMGLPMKVVSAECNLEANHVTVFFRSEERIDFRELVKRLSAALKMKVELRQAGPRDAAKMLGGLGRCGRTLCCATFLSELSPVSIRMAKDQNLPLNPTKISGVCGRLLCCLSYEVDAYRALKAKKATAVEVAPAAPPAVEVEEGAMLAVGGEGVAEQGRPEPGPAAEGVEAQPAGTEPGRKRRRPRRRKKKPEAVQAGTQPAPPPAP